MEQERTHLEEGTGDQLARRRVALEKAYQALPGYGSTEFWQVVEEPDLRNALPLEVLARCFRLAIASGDDAGRNRIIEVIIRRTQTANEYWAYHMLNNVRLQPDERNMLVHDLYADLCERMIRALMNTKRLFWEENFQHCLQYERKHVFQALMTREGRWNHQHGDGSLSPVNARRIPRTLIESLDRPAAYTNRETWEPEIEDVRAAQALLSVEQSELPLLIVRLPQKLKSVVWLIYWEGRTEKDVARVLGITDRTVRNRLQEALRLLHDILVSERGTIYG